MPNRLPTDTPDTEACFRQLRRNNACRSNKEFVLAGHTFAEIYAMAQGLRELFSAPACREEVICLAAENKAIIAAAVLSSLYGGPTLLLPFAFSGRALAEMQEATGFTSAVADRPRDFPAGTRVICPEPRPVRQIHKLPAIDPDAELLKLFTGGSTGAPRSWSKTANNLFSEAFYLAQKYQITSKDLIVATVSPYHIYGLLFSVIIPLISSAAVLPETPSFPGEIAAAVINNSATILASVPVHYRVLRDRQTSAGSLRLAFSSAGMLPRADNEEFYRQNNVPLIEVYGSTETGGIAVRVRARSEEAFSPFATVAWQTHHENLYVRSAYIAPDAHRDKQGFFATNDRIATGPNNTFFLKGRTDAVTKVGGKRVNLEEVCDKIKAQQGVDDCLVVTMADPGGRQSIIAGLIVGATIDLKELKKSLWSSLSLTPGPVSSKRLPTSPGQRPGNTT